jgi:hypothetical protein
MGNFFRKTRLSSALASRFLFLRGEVVRGNLKIRRERRMTEVLNRLLARTEVNDILEAERGRLGEVKTS